MTGNNENIKLREVLKEKFSEVEVIESVTGLVMVTAPTEMLSVMRKLRDNPELDFNLLTNLTSVDYPDMFCIIYNLVSLKHGFTLEVRVNVDKASPEVPSVVDIWGAADWQEREVYDLMGVTFNGHPRLKRILLGEEFQGYPLRKDFKYTGGRQ